MNLKKLLEDLAPYEPMCQDERGGCVHCGGTDDGGMFCGRFLSDHEKDCPWVRARIFIGDQLPADHSMGETRLKVGQRVEMRDGEWNVYKVIEANNTHAKLKCIEFYDIEDLGDKIECYAVDQEIWIAQFFAYNFLLEHQYDAAGNRQGV